MRPLKRLMAIILVVIPLMTSVLVNSRSILGSPNDGIFPPEGSYLNYGLAYERILPNGNFLGIVGNAEVNYFNSVNSTHIQMRLEAVVDLSWIQDKQDLNMTQHIITRSITIQNHQGKIINGVLFHFGNEIQIYNPIFIPLENISNKSDVILWSYNAFYSQTRSVQWNYKEIEVAEYFFKDEAYSKLSVNASFHLSTGILIHARCHFLENAFEGKIQHVLYVILENTNIPIMGIPDISSLFLFIGFASIFSILPFFILIIRFSKRSKIILEGGK